MYQTILLCYDGSDQGRKALREGARVAIAMKARTHLLAICRNMLDESIPEGVTPELATCEQDAATQLLEEGVSKLREHGLDATGRLVFGHPLEHIPIVARDIGADLIVIGHRPRGRLARWWSDSPGQTLLNLVTCSLLVAMNVEPGE